jgi:hypothetical protein
LTYAEQEDSEAEKTKENNFPQKKYACSFSLAAGVLYLMNL